MIKVCHLITGLGPGGAESMLCKLVTSPSVGVHHTVISMTPDGFFEPMLQDQGVTVHNLGLTRGVPHPLGVFRLMSLLRDIRPDVLQTWLYHADLLGLIAGKLARVPAIAWNIRCADMDMRRYSRLSRMMPHILARLSRGPDACIVNSRAGNREHERLGYRPKRWEVIPNGFDLAQFNPDAGRRETGRREIGADDDTFVVGMVARVDPMKDHAGLLAALSRLIRDGHNLIGVFIGKGCGSDGPLRAEAAAQGLEERVRLLGERRDVARLLPALDVSVLASHSEGFPNVIGEAMACGVPVLATDVGDCRDIIDQTGIIVPPGSVDALARGLADLHALGRNGRARLGEAARARIEKMYGLPAIAKRYGDVYRDLVEKR